jgi:hypothetical protein
MTTSLNDLDSLLARYAAGPDGVDAALSGLAEADLDRAIDRGQWTIRQIVHHLADGEPVYNLLVKLAVAVPGSTVNLGEYPGNDPWAEAMGWHERPVKPSLALLRACREDVAGLLRLRAGSWEHTVVFAMPEGQEDMVLPVHQMIRVLVDHLDEHLGEIAAIRQKHGL